VTAVNDEAVVPEFAHAVRGYDRYQVDDYIERLNEWASGAHTRAVDAERLAGEQADQLRVLRQKLADAEEGRPVAPDQTLKAAAERSAETVAAAIHQADEIRRRATADAEHRLDEAGRQAVAVVESVRQSVAGLSEEAGRERQEARLRVQTWLDDAANQAEQLRQQVVEEAERTRAEARSEAARLVADAEREASEIHERTDAQRRLAEEALQRLQAERSDIVTELGRLRGAIQALLSGAGVAIEQTSAAAAAGDDQDTDDQDADVATIAMEQVEIEAGPDGE
jgi:vacuolar-type H+-ATPase subunit H